MKRWLVKIQYVAVYDLDEKMTCKDTVCCCIWSRWKLHVKIQYMAVYDPDEKMTCKDTVVAVYALDEKMTC